MRIRSSLVVFAFLVSVFLPVVGKGQGVIIKQYALQDNISSIAFSPNGKILAIAEKRSGKILLLDIESGKVVRTLGTPENRRVTSLSFSPDGKVLVSKGLSGILLWDVESGKMLNSISAEYFGQVSFSPDGRVIASTEGYSIALWDAKSGLPLILLEGLQGTLYSLSFSPNGKMIAAGDSNGMIAIWDTVTGQLLKTIKGHDSSVYSVSFSPDSRILASGSSDDTIKLWDVRTGQLLKTLKGHQDDVMTLSFSPDGRVLASGSYDYTIKLWDARTGELLRSFKVSNTVSSISFSPNGRMLASSDDRIIRLWDTMVMLAGTKVAQEMASKIETAGDLFPVPEFKVSPRPNDLAIVIGIEKYKKLPKSEFSKKDAETVKEYLKAIGFRSENIEVLIDDQATKSTMEALIEDWLKSKAKKDSVVFIYYSGHGSADPSTKQGYLLPYDAELRFLQRTGYPISRLMENLSKLDVKYSVVVLDACFSGAGGRSLIAEGARPVVITMDKPTAKNVVLLSASKEDQISFSSTELQHGLLTYYFLKGIKEGKKDIAELFEYLSPKVSDRAKEEKNATQIPSISIDPQRDKGTFLLW